jgi:myo-inositol-1(or 4)-monophosphatase
VLAADIVTETDQAVEKMVSTTLSSKYPTFSFMGEETYKPGDLLTEAPTFICDPIDGTMNFVHRYHDVSISLGLAIKLEPVVGVIYNPFTNILWGGIKGKGSYTQVGGLDGEKKKLPLVPPSKMTDLTQCLVVVEWGSERQGNDFECRSSTFKKLTAKKEEGGAMIQGLRSVGSAALNLCEVAQGSFDCYWEGGCWAWVRQPEPFETSLNEPLIILQDVCAGVVILREAGGIFVDGNPGNWEPRIDARRHLAVRAGEGQRAIVEEFWSHIVGKFEVGL